MSRASARGLAILFVGQLCAISGDAKAQDISLNYDSLASLEEPIATDLGDVTISLTGIVDLSLTAEETSETDDVDFSPGLVANFNLAAETQLGNRWRVGAAYFGQYASDQFDSLLAAEGYSDNVAGFIGTSFGTLIAGNVSGQVRELTRRRRGAGHATLALDNFSVSLQDWGVAYLGRFGPSVVGAVVDNDGNFDLGIVFQRPLRQIDYRLAGRLLHVARSSFNTGPQVGTTGIAGTVEATYGSSTFDIGLAYEDLDLVSGSMDRWYVSTGARTQLGPWLLSAEGHLGELASRSEVSFAAGVAFFIARGLSLNAGANYRDSALSLGDGGVQTRDEWRGLVSLRFGF